MDNNEINWGRVARRLKDKADAMERHADSLDPLSRPARDIRTRSVILDALAEALWDGLDG